MFYFSINNFLIQYIVYLNFSNEVEDIYHSKKVLNLVLYSILFNES